MFPLPRPPASSLAERLLSPLGDRWIHVQRVAERAKDASHAVPAVDRELLVNAAWLHDIGYANQLRQSGFHPLDGAAFLRTHGYQDRLVCLVAHHSGAVFEADERGLSPELEAYKREDGPVLDALNYADMTTGPAGQIYEFDQRIDEILTRYLPQSPVHRAITRARPYLAAAVERTLVRLSHPT
jgi:putative nucleotidyltransferase with HDIG domain